ncbi:MAG: DHHA1 domain-containing protein [Clostridium sp.]
MGKIYYEDQDIKTFKASIVEVKNIDGKYHVRLDETAFFPGGGGQFCDLGVIGGEEVQNVYEECGYVYHVVKNIPIQSENLECSLDFERRKDGMHQHLGQHVLSGCFFKMYNANTVSFHLGKAISTVDIVGVLTEEQIRKVEKYANKIIEENLKVEIFRPSKDKLEKLTLRRTLPNTDEDIRVVKIGDLDINACCGVHSKSTIELRLIKIKKWEKNKGATRIEFLAGSRAIEDSINTDKYLTGVCKYLSSNEIEVINRVKNLNNEIKELGEKNRKLNSEMAIYEANELIGNSMKINGVKIVEKLFLDGDMNYIRKVIKKVVDNKNTVAIIGNEKGKNLNLIYAASKDFELIGMNELMKESLTMINGKGGGDKKLAQGFGISEECSKVLSEIIVRLNNLVKNGTKLYEKDLDV